MADTQVSRHPGQRRPPVHALMRAGGAAGAAGAGDPHQPAARSLRSERLRREVATLRRPA